MAATMKRTERGSARFYEVKGRQLPSVTTILQAAGKPWLAPWAAKVEREAIMEVVKETFDLDHYDNGQDFSKVVLDRLGKEKAHKKASDAAKEIGSAAHALIEHDGLVSLGLVEPKAPEGPPEALNAYAAYARWALNVTLVPRLVEETVYSETHGFAGTADLLGTMDRPDFSGRGSILADYKTAKAIYPEHLLQTAAYVKAAEEMGITERGTAGVVVRLPKIVGDPEFETRYIPPSDMGRLFETFLHVKALWEWLEKKEAWPWASSTGGSRRPTTSTRTSRWRSGG